MLETRCDKPMIKSADPVDPARVDGGSIEIPKTRTPYVVKRGIRRTAIAASNSALSPNRCPGFGSRGFPQRLKNYPRLYERKRISVSPTDQPLARSTAEARFLSLNTRDEAVCGVTTNGVVTRKEMVGAWRFELQTSCAQGKLKKAK
jgi:hypothetical protein